MMKIESNQKYLAMRKRKARRLSLLFVFLRVFPIHKDRIVISSYEGDGGFCCNPRYIAEELHGLHPEYEIVWLLHDTRKEFPDWAKPVRDSRINTAFYLSTAKVWIDNYRKPYGTLKRKGQLYIQTWHASIGFKAVGLFRGDNFPDIARIVSEWDSSLIDYVISNSNYCDAVYPKKLLYDGPTLRTGSPRVDPLINNKEDLRNRLRESLQLDKSVKLLLFAPTFRGGNQQGIKQVDSQIPAIDFGLLIDALTERFQGDWRVLLRLHPQLAAQMDKMPIMEKDGRLIDVSQIPDMSEILGGCDLLITDYSSCAFDSAFAGIPVLLYADDVDEYVKNRGRFMWTKDELPFDIAEDNASLIMNVKQFDENKYLDSVKSFMEKHEVIEDGNASKRIARFIECYVDSGNTETVSFENS